jgi:(4S)-4-hydroxy-5-phosphonooxypentane-2,3-dione isomerase
MYVVCVTAHVKDDQIDHFIQATLENARASRREPGNRRFDVLQSEADPTRFFLYEVYHHKDDFAAHQHTPHYLKWKETVAPWMARPREGMKHYSLFPGEEDWAVPPKA